MIAGVRYIVRLVCVLGLFVGLPACQTEAAVVGETGFESWLSDFKQEALQAGISPHTLEQAFEGVEPIARVVELDRKQPESTLTFPEYIARVLPESRVREGRQKLEDYGLLLGEISKAYQVPPQYIIALWGMESSFGKNTGGFDVVASLATLAYDGRRSEFFRSELLKALRILDEGHIAHADMQGSWAGAMGQCQFMPSSFLEFAVDYDGDGRKDIWNTRADIFASIANYLRQSGWKETVGWGQHVVVPAVVTPETSGREIRKPLSEWVELGVRAHTEKGFPSLRQETALVLLDGNSDIAYAVYDNYHVLMRWNRSVYFATAVGLFADRIAGTTP